MQFLTVTGNGCTVADGEPVELPVEGFVWVDCAYEEGRAWVEPVTRLTGVSVFEDHLLDAENESHPSYFDSTQRYEMVIFRALAFRPQLPGAEGSGIEQRAIRIRTRPTVFFVFPRCLVTLRNPESQLFAQLRERLQDAAALGQRIPALPEELMLRMVNGMVDRYLELRQPMTDQLERWQRRLLDPRRPFRGWSMLLDARMELMKLENLCEEQLDAIQEWRDERLEHDDRTAQTPAGAAHRPLSDLLEVRANDIVEHIHRVLNHTRRLETSIESAVQLHFSSTSYRTTEIMRVLTVLTAVFMPLNLIAGIFGMNFDNIPGLHSTAAFWGTLGFMAFTAIGLVAFFRWRRYLSDAELGLARPARRDTAEPGAVQPPDSARTQAR